MIVFPDIKSLSTQELFTLAIRVEEFSSRFFRCWANRLRAFDLDLVESLVNLAEEAENSRFTLSVLSHQLFDGDLPELDTQLYTAMVCHADLPGQRYLVIDEEETDEVLGIVSLLKRNTNTLLVAIDEKLQSEYNTPLADMANAPKSNFNAVLAGDSFNASMLNQ